MSDNQDLPQETSAPQDNPYEQLQEKILQEHARMGPDDSFEFSCRPGISCFNNCCGDVNIFLSPYDVLRLKRRLGITSGEFLEKHAMMPVNKDMKTPVVMLRMGDDDAKSCPFVTEEGCGVYTDRPWPCRMYPLGLAAQKDTPDGGRGDRFYFLLQETGCHGFEEQPRQWTVRKWMDDQGIEEQDEWSEQWKELTLHKFFEDGGSLSPEKMQMMFTACYDLDKFREFVFGSTLLQRFEVDEDYIEEMRYNDEALLRFSFHWLRFSLFGEQTMKPREAVIEAFKGKLEKKKLFKKDSAKTE